jgi:hypothetical protein
MTATLPAAEPRATLDHLVVAAATLADGVDYVATLTGIAPQVGGKHVAMGTHNAVLRLGERVYLEVIAIDPGARNQRRAGSISTISRCRRNSWSSRG